MRVGGIMQKSGPTFSGPLVHLGPGNDPIKKKSLNIVLHLSIVNYQLPHLEICCQKDRKLFGHKLDDTCFGQFWKYLGQMLGKMLLKEKRQIF